MTKPIKMGRIIDQFRESWQALTDVRKGNNSQKYTMTDAASAAFSVFFAQSPSFLSFQRDMEQKKRNSNAQKRCSIWSRFQATNRFEICWIQCLRQKFTPTTGGLSMNWQHRVTWKATSASKERS